MKDETALGPIQGLWRFYFCILPFEGQADKWSDSAQERYRFILSKANSVEYVSRDYYYGCMLDRNHRLVEAAELLLAVYNSERRGGEPQLRKDTYRRQGKSL